MGKALVIPGTDFSVNKLATVTFINPVPCTGISLSAASVSMAAVGSTATLTASLTPVNTTESVVWASSNPLVVDVAGGILLQKGVGTATITATCGNYSATCTVTCTMVYNGNADLFKLVNAAGYRTSSSHDYFKYTEANGYLEYINSGAYGYPLFNGQNSIPSTIKGKGGIPLPYGATTLTVTNPDSTVFDRLYLMFFDSKVASTTSSYHDSAKLILNPLFTVISGETSATIDLSAYELGDSDEFTVEFYDTAQAEITDDTLNSIITIS